MGNDLWNHIVSSGILDKIIAEIGVLVVALIGLASSIVVSHINQIKNAKLRNALLDVEKAVEMSVADVAQKEVDAAKAAAADGKLTADEAEGFKTIAIEQAKNFVSNDTLVLVENHVGDLNEWMGGLVEKYVRAGK
jgi:hypothetical protein